MSIRFVIFAALALIILFGIHYLLYYSLVRFFLITRNGAKIILLATISLLSASFIITSILSKWYENSFINILYVVSGFWIGALLNLLMAIFLIWILSSIISLAGLHPKTQIISIIIFSLAIIYSAYGVYNAFNVRVKNIEVEIKNLPEIWKGKTIVQLSDIHLGRVHGIKFLEHIVKKTNSLNPDIIAITGDLFDGMDDKNLNVFAKPLNEFKAGQRIFFITGNHETYLGINRVLSVIKQTKIKFLNNEAVDIDGLQIVGINFPELNKGEGVMGESQNVKKIIESLPNLSKNKPIILLYHAPTNIEQSKEVGANLQLSGHTHKGQLFPLGFITELIYKGYDYGLRKDGDFSIYITNGIGTWGPPMRTGNNPEIVAIKLK